MAQIQTRVDEHEPGDAIAEISAFCKNDIRGEAKERVESFFIKLYAAVNAWEPGMIRSQILAKINSKRLTQEERDAIEQKIDELRTLSGEQRSEINDRINEIKAWLNAKGYPGNVRDEIAALLERMIERAQSIDPEEVKALVEARLFTLQENVAQARNRAKDAIEQARETVDGLRLTEAEKEDLMQAVDLLIATARANSTNRQAQRDQRRSELVALLNEKGFPGRIRDAVVAAAEEAADRARAWAHGEKLVVEIAHMVVDFLKGYEYGAHLANAQESLGKLIEDLQTRVNSLKQTCADTDPLQNGMAGDPLVFGWLNYDFGVSDRFEGFTRMPDVCVSPNTLYQYACGGVADPALGCGAGYQCGRSGACEPIQ